MISSLLFPTILLSAVCWLPMSANAASLEKEHEVKVILQQMESDVLAFRDEMERVYSARCDTSTLAKCSRSNFNDCSSIYPNQKCMKADELVISSCGDGSSCNGLWDKTQTAVRIPVNLATERADNPSDPDAIESVCYSGLAEEYMVDKYTTGNQMYFGSDTGTFRIIPARHSEKCGEYDPRIRPWFVAASSGPKDVVLVIDVSGSMDDYDRIRLAREAAITIVDTLTVADRFAIVAFSEVATLVGEEAGLIRATTENKRRMIEGIGSLRAGGGTNFHAGFDTAFDAIDRTILGESTSGCNVAVLFMTDGQITVGPGVDGGTAEEEVTNLVNERTGKLATSFNRKTTIFTFSLGNQADHRVTKSIACSTGGIWTPVDDFSDDLIAAMSSYYKLFALGLGEGGNEDFTAWVEPYEFHTAGKMGTSVSAPVYDRSVVPPLFLGVVAVDSHMDAIAEILGEEATSSTMLDRFVLMSTARCPKIELASRELDALRYLGGGEEGTCGDSNVTDDFAGIVPEKCPFQSDLPNNLWHNTAMKGKDYTDRVCCEHGGTVPSDSCPASAEATGSSLGTDRSISGTTEVSSESVSGIVIIVGVVAAVVVVVLLAVLVFVWKRKSNQSGEYRTTTVPVAVAVAAPDMAGSTTNNRAEGDIEMLNRFDSSMRHDVAGTAPDVAPTAPPAFNPSCKDTL